MSQFSRLKNVKYTEDSVQSTKYTAYINGSIKNHRENLIKIKSWSEKNQ